MVTSDILEPDLFAVARAHADTSDTTFGTVLRLVHDTADGDFDDAVDKYLTSRHRAHRRIAGTLVRHARCDHPDCVARVAAAARQVELDMITALRADPTLTHDIRSWEPVFSFQVRSTVAVRRDGRVNVDGVA